MHVINALFFFFPSAAIPNPPSNVQVEASEDKSSTVRVTWDIPDEWSRMYDPHGNLLRYKIRYKADSDQSADWQEVNT